MLGRLCAGDDLASADDGTAGGDQFAALFGVSSIGVQGYLAVVAQVGLIALVTAATSRHTVKRTIETIH